MTIQCHKLVTKLEMFILTSDVDKDSPITWTSMEWCLGWERYLKKRTVLAEETWRLEFRSVGKPGRNRGVAEASQKKTLLQGKGKRTAEQDPQCPLLASVCMHRCIHQTHTHTQLTHVSHMHLGQTPLCTHAHTHQKMKCLLALNFYYMLF